MNNNSLLFGLVGFMLGGLLVSIAATTFEKPNDTDMGRPSMSEMSESSMSHSSTATLASKQGDAYDAAFLNDMIEHHEGAVAMAILSDTRSNHQEIKTLSKNILEAQKQEITQMKQWQKQWGYEVQ